MDVLREHALKPDSKVRINKVEVLLNSVLGKSSPANVVPLFSQRGLLRCTPPTHVRAHCLCR